MKKAFTLLLALMLVLGLCSTAWAASTTTKEVTYCDHNGESATCNAEVLIDNSKSVSLKSGKCYVVEGDVKIGGKLTIQDDVTLILADGASLTVSGIRVSGKSTDAPHLTIYGQSSNTGKLTVTGYNDGDYGSGRGIYLYDNNDEGSLTINGGDITVNGADVTSEANSTGIVVHSLTVNGGKLTVRGGSAPMASTGIYVGGKYISDDSETFVTDGLGAFTVNGGTVVAVGGKSLISYGITVAGVATVSGGTVTATGSNCSTGEIPTSTGLYALGLAVSGGTLNGSGGSISSTANGTEAGSYGVLVAMYQFEGDDENTFRGGNITVSGGVINATGGAVSVTADGVASAWSSGMYAAGGIAVVGGEIRATGKAADGYGGAWSYGVYSDGKTDVKDGGKITGTSGVATCRGEEDECVAWSCGVYSEETFTVTGGGAVTGTSGGASGCGDREETNVCSFGVYGDVEIIVSGGGKITGTSGNATGHSKKEMYSEGVRSDIGKIIADENAVVSHDGEIVVLTHHVKHNVSVADTADSSETLEAGIVDSPKTFDEGITAYVIMALTSAFGSAAVAGKKKYL